MPTFDFKCTSCDEVWEEHIPMDGQTPLCPECGGAWTLKVYKKAPAMMGQYIKPYDYIDRDTSQRTKPIRSVVPKNYKKDNE